MTLLSFSLARLRHGFRYWYCCPITRHAYLLFMLGFFFFPSSRGHNNLFYLLVLAPWLLGFPLASWRRLLRSAVYGLSLALISVLVASAFVHSSNTAVRWEYTRHGIHVLAFLTITVDLFLDDPALWNRLQRWLAATVVVCAPLSILVFYSLYTLDLADTLDGRLQGLGRLSHSGLGSAAYGVVGILAWMGWHRSPPLNTPPATKSPWQRWDTWLQRHERTLYGGTLLAVALFLILARSRGALAAVLGTTLVVSLAERRWWPVLVLGALVLCYGLSVAIGIIEFGYLGIREGGDSFRLALWSQSVDKYLAAPWSGYGIQQDFSYAIPLPPYHPPFTHPHNAVLATALYGGLVALVLLLGLLLAALRVGYGELCRGQSWLFALLVFGALFILTDDYRLIDHPRPFWLYFWLPIALAAWRELAIDPPATKQSDDGPPPWKTD